VTVFPNTLFKKVTQIIVIKNPIKSSKKADHKQKRKLTLTSKEAKMPSTKFPLLGQSAQ
jgi:hypothetical protein